MCMFACVFDLYVLPFPFPNLLFFIFEATVGAVLVRVVSKCYVPVLTHLICFKICQDIIYIFQSISVMNKGSEGRYLVTFLENPKMYQKILEYVRNHYLATLGIIKNP